MLRKTSTLVVTIAIIMALCVSLGGCAQKAKPSAEVEALKSQLAAAVAHSEKATAQLDYLTTELSSAKA